MEKSHVFLVHGMGSCPPGWSANWQQSIGRLAKNFEPYKGGRALTEDLKFVEIHYDHVFDGTEAKPGYRRRWNSLATALQDANLPADVRPAIDLLRSDDPGHGAAVDFFWTHLLDPLLWYGLLEARKAVLATVCDQLITGLEAAIAAGARAHIVAHSLGTSVVHDALVCLTDSDFTQGRLDPFQGGRRWDSLTNVANVARLLRATRSPSSRLGVADYDPLRSRVHPSDGGLVRRFINIRHRWDPFTFLRTFGDQLSYGGCQYFLGLRFAKPLAIHDLETQIARPDVAAEILRTVLGNQQFGRDAEIDAGRPAYNQSFPQTAEAFQAVKTVAGGIGETGDVDLAQLARFLLAIVNELQKLRTGGP